MPTPSIVMSPTGPAVSRLAYGVWRLKADPEGADAQRVLAKIQTCLDLGITTFDHADVYGGYSCEELFGRALREAPGLRERLQIVTKCGVMLPHAARPRNRIKHYDLSADHIVRSVERSLVNLATDRIDVLLLHRPSPLMDPDEIATALGRLHKQGKILHAGVSNFTSSQVDMIASRLDVPLVTNQVEVNPLLLDAFTDGTLDHCVRTKMTPMAWSPAAGGRLFTSDDPRAVNVRAALADLASRHGVGEDAILYAWLLAHPSRMVVVLGTNQMERVRTAVSAFDVRLDVQDWFSLWSAAGGPLP
jgi:predicted oxidoreductase